MRAQADLVEIAAYLLDKASAGTADRVIRGILVRLERLRAFPRSGAPRDHIRPGLRAVFKRPYVAYYVPTREELVVVRVVHGSRDVEAISAEGGFQN